MIIGVFRTERMLHERLRYLGTRCTGRRRYRWPDVRAGLMAHATHSGLARSGWRTTAFAGRTSLYKAFVEEATKCYVDALQHSGPDLAALGSLYAKISRIRARVSFGSMSRYAACRRTLPQLYRAWKANIPISRLLHSQISECRDIGKKLVCELSARRVVVGITRRVSSSIRRHRAARLALTGRRSLQSWLDRAWSLR